MNTILRLSARLALICAGLFIGNANAQTVIWSEDFGTDGGGGCTSQGTPAVGFNGGNGAWTETLTGVNDLEANLWFVSTMEEGVGAGNCGDGCGATSPNATNRTLHLSNAAVPLLGLTADQGAAYNAGGFCPGFFCVATDRRIESPNIDLSAQANNMTLTFEYIHLGDGTDEAELMYFDGATWQSLGVMPNSAAGACSPQHTWALYTWVMPAGLNIANFRIGWRWENNDEGVGTDPSIAVDNIQITIPTTATQPVASFSVLSNTICVGDCIDFTDLSTNGSNGPNNSWVWTVTPAGGPSIPSVQNPTNQCFNTAGVYDVTLTVSDGTDSDDTTIAITVNNCALPVASFIPSQTNICVGDCIDFTDNSTNGANGPNNSWVWTVTPAGGPSIPSVQNPTGQCFNTAGSYDVTLTVSDGTDSDDTTITITVNNCALPVASFTVASTTICAGDCIDFTDNSTNGANGPNNSWVWTVTPAGGPSIPSVQNPTNQCFNTAGVYDVTLTVSDGTDSDDTTITITVNNCNLPIASFTPSSTNLCEADCINLTDNSTDGSAGPINSWTWTVNPAAGAPAIPSVQNPTNICFNTAGTYDITLTVSDGTDSDDTTITITVVACAVPVAAFTGPTSFCEGQCYDFTDMSTGNPTSWEWDFGGGGTPNTSSNQNPSNICFNTSGTFDIELIVSNSNGSDTITQTITVNPLPIVNAGVDVTIDIGTSTVLNPAGSSGNYVWSPILGLSCSNCLNPTASPITTTTYTVTVTDGNGCSASDDVTVFINVVEGVGVPNAFSPNNDGVNDILYVKGNGIESMTLRIYNRYGQKVFESSEQTIGWDGTFNNKELNSGVFAYVLEYNFYGQDRESLKGNITLMK